MNIFKKSLNIFILQESQKQNSQNLMIITTVVILYFEVEPPFQKFYNILFRGVSNFSNCFTQYLKGNNSEEKHLLNVFVTL